jgi:tetratricopeptide (TPR) repeat protein
MLRALIGGCVVLVVAIEAPAAEDPEAEYTRGLVAYQAGHYAEAITVFDDVLQAQPQRASALYYRGLAKAKLGKFADAIPDLEMAKQQDPTLPVAGSLGAAYFQLQRYREAKPWLQKALSEEPAGAASANLALGIIAYNEENYAEAETYLAQAEAGGPNVQGTAAYYRGLVATRQARDADARAAFTRARAAGDPSIAEAAARQLALLSSRKVPSQVAGLRSRPMPLPEAPLARLYLLAGYEYESNVVLEDTPFITNKSGNRFVLGAGGTYRLMDTEQVRWDLSYDFYQNVYLDLSNSLDLQGHTVRSSTAFGSGTVVPGFHLSYSAYLIGSSGYFDEMVGTPFVAFEEAGIGETQLFCRIRGRDYLSPPFDPVEDALNYAVGFRQFFRLGTGGQTIDVGYQFDRNATRGTSTPRSGLPDSEDFDYEGHEADAGVSSPLASIGVLEVRYGYRAEDYLHFNSLLQFLGKRHDNTNYFNSVLTRDLTEHLYGRLQYRGRFNNSNVNDFDYDRHTVSLTMGLRF